MSHRDHPAFALCWAGLAHAAERGPMARLRHRVLQPARGRLLVVGAGQGHDLHYLVAAAAEFRRVLAPGGALLLPEHVRASTRRWLALAQDRVDAVWGAFAGGCHLNRDPVAALARAGFDTSEVVDHHLARFLPLIDAAVLGIARPAGR